MQKNVNLNDIYKAIKLLNNSCKGKDKGYDLRESIRHLRSYIKDFVRVDPYLDRGKEKAFYEKDSIVMTVGTLRDHHMVTINPKLVWVDNYAQWLKNPENTKLYDKEDYFRIGNDYYRKFEYIEHDGKAYNKKDYVLYNGEIIERSKACTCEWHRYDYGSHSSIDGEVVLIADEGEEFAKDKSNENFLLTVHINSYSSTVYCHDFIKSLFRIGNKRFMPSGANIYLTKEDLNNFNFKISESHALACVSEQNLAAFSKEQNIKSGTECIMNALSQTNFSIEMWLEPRSTSLKQKLINIIVHKRRRHYSNASFGGLKELFIRLRAIKKMYEVEAEYAN